MRRYGFPVHDMRRDGRLPEVTSSNPVAGDVKGEALGLAVQVVGPGANADAVIRLADRFVEWLAPATRASGRGQTAAPAEMRSRRLRIPGGVGAGRRQPLTILADGHAATERRPWSHC